MSKEKFELFTDEVFVNEAKTITLMFLADAPIPRIAERFDLTESAVIEVLREVLKEQLL